MRADEAVQSGDGRTPKTTGTSEPPGTTVTTAPLVQPVPRGPGAFLADTATLYARSLLKLWRRPIMLYFSLVQPMIWLLLFGQLFNRITRFPGADEAFGGKSYFQFFMPAVILQTILFGAAQSGIGIIADMDSGFLDKLLTTPVSRMAILLGKILGDLTRMLIQALVIVALTWGFGQLQAERVRYEYGIPGILGALGVAILVALALAGFHVFVALRTRNTETAFLIANFLTLPLLFTSSAQLPLQLLPEWLQVVARFNPVTYAIDVMRIAFNGPQAVPDRDAGQTILIALVVLTALTALTLSLAVRSFRRAVR
jgi:ABC-2 type transport system permease protein